MNRDELLDKLAMELAEWPIDMPPPNLPGLWSCHHEWRCQARGDAKQIFGHDWLQRREELINCPPDSEAPEWAKWKAQDSDGWWCWFAGKPDISGTAWHYDEKPHKSKAGKKGETPSGHRWEDTLTRINRDDNTSTPEEDEEFERIQARQDANRPYEADARMLDAQFAEAMVECGCGDKYPANSYGAGFTVANDGVCENCDSYIDKPNANSILNAAAHHMQDRAATYDKPEGERSMVATVAAFKSTTGIALTEEQGWHFMALLKLVRSQQGDYRADSYEDGVAYFALAGEAAAKDRAK